MALSPRSLFLSLLLASVGSAQTLEVLGPSGPVPPDGFTVAVVKRGADGSPTPFQNPSISADGADLRPAPPQPPLQTFLVVPTAGAREVRIRASDGALRTELRFPVGPPAARVELSLDPPTPVKGRDQRATLTVRLLNAAGQPDAESAPPVLRANVGQLQAVERVGPGVFRAGYLLPPTRYPEVAILAALAPWPHPNSVHGVFGRLLVPLSTAIDLPGRTEPNAEMSIEIAGQRFGPVRSGPDGRFQLPVVVPPGHRFGKGLAVDRLGNRRNAKIDLALPPTDQLACVANPARLPGDGISRGRVLCATTDPYGKPVASARVSLSAQRGTVQGPRTLEGGMLEWIYTAPKSTTFQPDTLRASWSQAGAASREELTLSLEQGPAEKLELSLGEPLVHRGSQLPLGFWVKDRLDRPRQGARVALFATAGEARELTESDPGRWRARYVPPERGTEESATLQARAYGPMGADPARVVAWLERGRLVLGVADLAGLPVPGQRLLAGTREVTTGEDGTVDLGPPTPGKLEVSHAQWPGLRQTLFVLDGPQLYPRTDPLGSAVQTVTVKLAPAIPVNVRIQVEGRQVRYWAEDAEGKVLPDRRLELQLSGGSHGPPQERGGRFAITVVTQSPITVSVADVLTGVTGLAEVKP